MKIVIDAFGGDFAPYEILKGSILAKKEINNLDITFCGNKQKLEASAKEIGLNLSDFEIVDAKNTMSSDENPSNILNEKNQCSMAIALKLLNEPEIDAFVSAGNTGALAVGASYYAKKIKNVKRAALSPILPSLKGKMLLIDAGANLQCNENVLLQFAIMGKIYAEEILKIKNPRIGLANVGAEPQKGTQTLKAAHNLLKNYDKLNFVGNIEARYIPLGVCDVVVCDGLVGNMILKTIEGTAKFLTQSLKKVFYKNIKTKIAAALLKKDMLCLKNDINYKNYGGAIFLGMQKPIIKAHGNSNAKTFKQSILSAAFCANQKICLKISDNLKNIKNDEV